MTDDGTKAKYRLPRWMRGDRRPDYLIGAEGQLYLRRWWVLPRNRWFNVYLHQFMRSDDPRACHDHPWWNVSFILSKGGYWEWVRDPETGIETPHKRRRFRPYLRGPEAAHRVMLTWHDSNGYAPVWSVFVTGPRVRDWGFWCGARWVPWQQFTKARPGGNEVGPGCDA